MTQKDEQYLYRVFYTKRFKRSIRRLRKSGANLRKLTQVINILRSGDQLPPRYRDHALTGRMKGSRECHIAPDWLLVYEKDKDALTLVLVSTGTHRDTLGIE